MGTSHDDTCDLTYWVSFLRIIYQEQFPKYNEYFLFAKMIIQFLNRTSTSESKYVTDLSSIDESIAKATAEDKI